MPFMHVLVGAPADLGAALRLLDQDAKRLTPLIGAVSQHAVLSWADCSYEVRARACDRRHGD
jgi:hypothetical protein